MKINEIKRLNNEDGAHVLYEIGAYEVSHSKYNSGYERICVDKKVWNEEYLPDIYYNDDCFGSGKKELKIQTTSYGALNIEEIDKMMEKLKEAQMVVKELTKFFGLE